MKPGRLLRVIQGRALREVGVGGSDTGRARHGLTAPADAATCSCEQLFFPDVLDAECPLHGYQVPPRLFVRTGLCAEGRHSFCQNRVYQGHNGLRSVYVPCDCECHDSALRAAA